MADVKDFLKYVATWRSSKEIRVHFDLSNSSFYHLIKWHKKAGFIEVQSCGGIEKGKTNRTYLYKTLE